jgi:hypothetical protein
MKKYKEEKSNPKTKAKGENCKIRGIPTPYIFPQFHTQKRPLLEVPLN